MRHFSAVRSPAWGHPTRHGGTTALVLAATLASGLVLADVQPCLAGTGVRGRVLLPRSTQTRNAKGAKIRETLDARDAVVYVTVAPGGNARKLSGRASRQDIHLEGDRFTPRVLPVVAGSEVRFRNEDRVYHNVFSVSPAGRFDLGNLAPGGKRETRFKSPGVINLFCELHPAAAGFVVVCPNWFFTRVGASGEYVLPPLPRGAYVVHAWHPRLGVTRRSIRVTGREAVTLDLRL
jgi:plastocyanin